MSKNLIILLLFVFFGCHLDSIEGPSGDVWFPILDSSEEESVLFIQEEEPCIPRPEICNNLDDDCDGVIDNDLTNERYYGSPVTKGVGECRSEIKECWEGRWVYTQVQVLPVEEICDGLDNNCNGLTDETWTEKFLEEYCGKFNPEECVKYQIDECHYKPQCIAIHGPFEEICGDGIDQDCDGVIDNGCTDLKQDVCNGFDDDQDGETDEQIESAVQCYTGPPGTKGVGECRSGIHLCVNGKIDTSQCLYEVLPKLEWCDDVDNDCDGQTDEGFSSTTDLIDVMIILDISGSMFPYIPNIVNGLTSFVQNYTANTHVQFGLIYIGTIGAPYYKVVYNMGPVGGLINELNNLPSDGGIEPSYDAIKFLIDPVNPLQIFWKFNSQKVIILFTDEKGQTNSNVTEGQLAANIGDFILYSFVNFGEDFDEILGPEFVFDLQANDLEDQIGFAFMSICF